MNGDPPTIRDFMLSLDYPFEFDEVQLRVAEKKLAIAALPFSIREFHDIRARGGSKTFDTMIIALYLASLGFEGIWFAALAKQMEQPKKYLKKIVERSYLKYLISDLMKESVIFQTGGELRIYNLTEDNARSPRADFIIYDELARADPDAYNAASSILSVTQLGLIINISTPCKTTIEEQRYEIIKRREIHHNEVLTSELWWNDISFLARKKEWYEEQKKILPGWYFRQEHECSHELPMGAVFQNVNYGEYPDWLMEDIKNQWLCSGVDWNPVAGHWVAGGKWTKDLRNFVVLEEHDIGQGYAVDMNIEQFHVIALRGVNGDHLTMEEGGINEEYTKWFKKMQDVVNLGYPEQNYHYEEWDSAGLNKLQAVTYIIQNGITIWVDKVRFPNLAKMIEDCQWDPDSPEPKIKKDASNSPHALDAFLHAISKRNRNVAEVEMGRFY